ncbi:hypothetical protein [Gordonia sp. ABSL49_1]|uniref:hypothetical protein n=1 Tax=Gordonia sp. ABSL49_1 TaxID=2920941 RepID=UPI001F0EF477|nr:hypothetical protein [Gordonia sp. ABSL49_1]MCH5644091.1 hypothetical protein [Gordonia sp. ABSL49_1]
MDIPNLYAVVQTRPLLITHDVAVIGLESWMIAGDVLAVRPRPWPPSTTRTR